MLKQNKYEIIKKSEIADGIFDFTIKCEDVASIAEPGQFVHISVPGYFLRRPISICEIDKDRGTIRIVVQVRGKGTEAMSKLEEGEKMDLLGPLGNGFTINDSKDPVVLIGGGIGTPPMLALADIYVGKGVTRIQTQNITDQRFNSAVCGIVTGTVEEIDASVLTKQFTDFFNTYSAAVLDEFSAYKQSMEKYLTEIAGVYDSYVSKTEGLFAQYESQFNERYSSFESTLDNF